ncbi:MAG: hypothetical protein K1000chlam4_00348 [Chlamydiae bacterium]|nr:hypothetical protein [Chlamydiota bacterium]
MRVRRAFQKRFDSNHSFVGAQRQPNGAALHQNCAGDSEQIRQRKGYIHLIATLVLLFPKGERFRIPVFRNKH